MGTYRVRFAGNAWRLLILVLPVLAGCATQATLRISSEPLGAYITEIGSGRAAGVAPTEVYYDPNALAQHKDEHGCYRVLGFQAQWVSGAQAVLNPIRLCGGGPTSLYEISVSRNPSDPDLGRDLEFAMQVEALLVQRQQAKAASLSAAAAISQAFDAAKQQRVTCTTRPGFDGQSILTNCR